MLNNGHLEALAKREPGKVVSILHLLTERDRLVLLGHSENLLAIWNDQ